MKIKEYHDTTENINNRKSLQMFRKQELQDLAHRSGIDTEETVPQIRECLLNFLFESYQPSRIICSNNKPDGNFEFEQDIMEELK